MRHTLTSLAALVAMAGLWLVSAPGASAQEQEASGPPLSVDGAVITTAVQDREPVDEVASVPPDVGELVCWTRIVGAEDETEVEHVWYHGEEEVARVTLQVASPSWRTWTSKEILPDWTGDWRVEVVGPDGGVLETLTFRVEDESGGR